VQRTLARATARRPAQQPQRTWKRRGELAEALVDVARDADLHALGADRLDEVHLARRAGAHAHVEQEISGQGVDPLGELRGSAACARDSRNSRLKPTGELPEASRGDERQPATRRRIIARGRRTRDARRTSDRVAWAGEHRAAEGAQRRRLRLRRHA